MKGFLSLSQNPSPKKRQTVLNCPQMGSEFSLSPFFWILKRYLIISIIYFTFCTVLMTLLAFFTPLFSKEHILGFIALLLLLGFSGSTVIFIFVVYTFLKPFALSVRKIEELAQSDGKPLKTPSEKNIPDEFRKLNQNIQIIYENMRQKSLGLAREKAELEAIASAVSDAIIAVDLNQKIIFSNLRSQKLFPLDNEKNQTLKDVLDSKEILSACGKCLKFGSKALINQEIEVGQYKQKRLFDVSITSLVYREKKIDGAVIVFHDETEIKNTEKAQSDFVANVSHELKTPLTVINGFVETMINDLSLGNASGMKNFLNITKRNVKRLIALIDDLLSLSSIDSEMDLKKEEIDTREATHLSCETIKTDKHELHCTYKVKSVLAERRWLEQVLYNLISNAVKYTPPGSRIDVIWEKHPHFILLTVKDNGEGIPLQHQSRIFERFYRVDADRSREKGGTGIGLAIVKQVVEKHGGKVYLTSRRRGKGAKFTCSFPR